LHILAAVSYVKDAKGNRIGVVGINRDITERKRAEKMMQMAQKSESLNLLAGGIAHDFNNLLTGILTQISVARRKLATHHSVTAHLEKAITSTEHAAALTRQLLAYTGQGAFLVEAVDLNRLIYDTIGLLEAMLPKWVQLDLKLAPALPTIDIDRGQLQQVAMNLVLNAMESLAGAGGTIGIETGVTDISPQTARAYIGKTHPVPGQYVYLTVLDDGIGMSDEIVDRIFDPYFTTKTEGSGLGLSATLGTAQKYGGGICVESVPGQGTCFTLIFPPGESLPVPPSQPRVTSIRSQQSVLVIDDEEPVRAAVHDILAMEGMTVLQACDGREGVETFAAHRQEIDIVLLDMQMPVMSGEETFYALRAIDPQIKIVLSSGYNESESTKNLAGQSLAGFLQKPYDVDTLVGIMQEAFRYEG